MLWTGSGWNVTWYDRVKVLAGFEFIHLNIPSRTIIIASSSDVKNGVFGVLGELFPDTEFRVDGVLVFCDASMCVTPEVGRLGGGTFL